MSQLMDWNTLYNITRTDDRKNKAYSINTIRNAFQQDYDRIIFSSAFRRLQNKTQVFPLPGPVLVHNRLTHSLEVASVGRSIGKIVGLQLAQRAPDNEAFYEFYKNELGTVVASAALAHDIGNPPFGHSGEDAIRHYFTQLSGGVKEYFEQNLKEEEKKDFLLFEGNANAIRVLTHQFSERSSSFNLTYTTLASILKYPSSSIEGFRFTETQQISHKKSGYFQSERLLFHQIAETFNLLKLEGHNESYSRHPFVYLTEAADDICYQIIDMEDAHRLKIIPFNDLEAMFMPVIKRNSKIDVFDKFYNKYIGFKDVNQKVQYLRAVWISVMIQLVADKFIEKEEEILSGKLNNGLLSCLDNDNKCLLTAIERYSIDHIYNYRNVAEIEIAGFNIIGNLLDLFMQALIYHNQSKSKMVLELIPKQYLIVLNDSNKAYQNILSIVDFVSGMTDLYALELYQKINGWRI